MGIPWDGMGWDRHNLLWDGMGWDRKICPMDKPANKLSFRVLCCYQLNSFTFKRCRNDQYVDRDRLSWSIASDFE